MDRRPNKSPQPLDVEVAARDTHEHEATRNVRLNEFLEKMSIQGTPHRAIARKLGVRPQFLSDCKAGRRPIGELFARRMEATFGVPHRWVLGEDVDYGSIDLDNICEEHSPESISLFVF